MTTHSTALRIVFYFIPAGLVVLLHGTLSLGFDAYTRVPPLDIPMHLAGGVAISLAIFACLGLAEERSLVNVTHPLVRLLLIVSLTTTAATGWEFVEFASDRLFDTGAQKGLEDTLSDMAFGILGGTILASALVLTRRRNATPR